ARLSGRHARLAWLTLLGLSALGVALGAALSAALRAAPSARGGRWALSCGAAAAALMWADLRVLPGLYPPLHLALGRAALVAVALALLAPLARLARGARLALVAALAALALSPTLTLSGGDDHRLAALQAAPWLEGGLSWARAWTDWDGDGYSSWFAGGDCAPLDAAVSPGAREVPGNGVDDNCRAGDLTPAARPFTRAPAPRDPAPTSVVLVTIDTTRPDHLSVYGYERDTTPHLRAWAAGAAVFERAYSASAWTSIAVSSLMRGLYPSHLRWTRVYETSRYRLVRAAEAARLPRGEHLRLSFTMPLDEPREPLAETLKRRGLYTAAVVDDGYGEFLSPKMGLGRGFERFELVDRLPRAQRNDAGAVTRALEVLEARPRDRRFFLWLHLFGPHDPHTRHPDLDDFGGGVVGDYDHELAYADQQLGRLLSALEALRAEEPVLVAVTSDHGELLESPRRFHGVDLHEQSVRVPLLIRGEGWPAGRVAAPVSLVDLAPTLLAATRTPPAHALDGVDLADLARGAAPPRRALFAETWYIKTDGELIRDYAAAFDGEWKAVHRRDAQLTLLERQDDPARPARAWPRDTPGARFALDALEVYLEESSNDRGAETALKRTPAPPAPPAPPASPASPALRLNRALRPPPPPPAP
ncbi:MAG: hypothetical protein FJ138_18145, partial [Deltaproteobacteria bacterium]|nr:hypothetical protein [Deltaproteobacteria bacterium]